MHVRVKLSSVWASLQRIRILLVEMPRLLSDIIAETVKSQYDMELVGELANRAGLLAAVDRMGVDVVVVRVNDSELPFEFESLLATHSFIRVLGVAEDGRRSFLYELRPQMTLLGEVSPLELVEAIRAAVPRQS